jgi:protein-S-isoprenylcysteine O-methyltransferase Ste14
MIDLPAALVTLVVWLYWLRVGAMAWRIRRRTRRLSGVVPQQGLERAMWVIWIPLVSAWMTLPWLAATRVQGSLALPALAREGAWWWMRAAAALAAVLCLWATLRCWKQMGARWKMSVTPDERTELITDGPFARVRHPIYGYSIALMLATLVVVPTVPMLVVALIHVGLMLIKARNEERHLLAQHGDAYARYVARTGRFFPRLDAGRR